MALNLIPIASVNPAPSTPAIANTNLAGTTHMASNNIPIDPALVSNTVSVANTNLTGTTPLASNRIPAANVNPASNTVPIANTNLTGTTHMASNAIPIANASPTPSIPAIANSYLTGTTHMASNNIPVANPPRAPSITAIASPYAASNAVARVPNSLAADVMKRMRAINPSTHPIPFPIGFYEPEHNAPDMALKWVATAYDPVNSYSPSLFSDRMLTSVQANNHDLSCMCYRLCQWLGCTQDSYRIVLGYNPHRGWTNRWDPDLLNQFSSTIYSVQQKVHQVGMRIMWDDMIAAERLRTPPGMWPLVLGDEEMYGLTGK